MESNDGSITSQCILVRPRLFFVVAFVDAYKHCLATQTCISLDGGGAFVWKKVVVRMLLVLAETDKLKRRRRGREAEGEEKSLAELAL